MTLTDRQIERYSRQLVVPRFGAAAQGRLLAARAMVVAAPRECDSTLPYLVGAGVGQIDLLGPAAPAQFERLVRAARNLNPDVTLRPLAPAEIEGSRTANLVLIFISDSDTLARARALLDQRRAPAVADRSECALVAARLVSPARLVVIPSRPRCSPGPDAWGLLGPIAAAVDNADFISSVATLEGLKLLAEVHAAEAPVLVEFEGYRTAVREIDPFSGCPRRTDEPARRDD